MVKVKYVALKRTDEDRKE